MVLAENQAAARKLAAEKARILQICQAPQYEGRYCRLLCEDLNPSEAARTPGHHVIPGGIPADSLYWSYRFYEEEEGLAEEGN